MTLQTSDLSFEFRTVQQQTLSSIYSLNFNFKLEQNVKLTKKKKKEIECLANNQYFLTQLIELNNKLNFQIKWLFLKAKQHDHTGQQINGYYSMIRILLALFKLVSKNVRKLKETSRLKTEMIETLNIVRYFVYLIDNMIAIFDYKTNSSQPLDNDQKNLFSLSIENYKRINLLALNEDAQRALSVIYGPSGVFWYSKSMRNVFKAFRLLLIGFTSNPFRFLHCFVNSKECGKNVARKSMNATVEYVTRSVSAVEYKVYNRAYFALINLSKALRYEARTVQVKVSTSFKVPTNNATNNNNDESNHLQFVDEHNQRKVRCRLITGFTKSFTRKYCKEHKLSVKNIDPINEINPTKCVIFQLHGGGFVIGSPDSHEIYLRKWAMKLNGIPILSVDYQLRVAYPRAIQDVLDTYLKLFTHGNTRQQSNNKRTKLENEINQAEKIFGFTPESVMLVGDSCGSNLILSLLCCLNDIRRQRLDSNKAIDFIMPFALTTIYPVFDLRAVCSPSKIIGNLDPILTSSNIMSMHGCYGNLTNHAQKCNKIVNRLKNRHVKPWYVCGDEECASENQNKRTVDRDCAKKHVENRFIQMNDHLNTPFASPAIYQHYEDYKNITINLIGTHICPLLDDAVEMYRKWPGAKTMHIFDGLPHGFIQFIDLSPSSKKASKKIVQIINSTIEDYSTKWIKMNAIDNNNEKIIQTDKNFIETVETKQDRQSQLLNTPINADDKKILSSKNIAKSNLIADLTPVIEEKL